MSVLPDQLASHDSLLTLVEERSGVRARDCYQCGKCSAGCPLSSFMDLQPHQVIRAVQLGQAELAFRSSTIWLCTSCQTCSTRCPMQVDLARIMDSLRQMSRAARVSPAESGVVLGNDLFLESVKRLGRLFEVGLVAGINLGTMRPFENVMEVGLPLFRKGKLHLLPARVKGPEVKEIFRKNGE